MNNDRTDNLQKNQENNKDILINECNATMMNNEKPDNTDPEIVEFAIKFKKVYEHLFENYLKNLK